MVDPHDGYAELTATLTTTDSDGSLFTYTTAMIVTNDGVFLDSPTLVAPLRTDTMGEGNETPQSVGSKVKPEDEDGGPAPTPEEEEFEGVNTGVNSPEFLPPFETTDAAGVQIMTPVTQSAPDQATGTPPAMQIVGMAGVSTISLKVSALACLLLLLV